MDTSKKINKLFLENAEGKIVLPNFQRGFEWKVEEQQKKLLSSILALLPIGTILLLEGRKGDFATRQLCYNEEEFEQNEECLYLLDGQQRTSTLRAIFSNLLGGKNDWEERYDKLYKGLRNRWFIDVKKLELENIFGYVDLKFKSVNKTEPSQFLDFITYKTVTKQNKKEWFHPNFSKDSSGKVLDGHKLKNEIAKHLNQAGLIPLYDVFDAVNIQEKSLLDYTLEKLATERMTELKAESVGNDELTVRLLNNVLPEIEELLEIDDSMNEQTINFAWSTLASDWKKDMFNYLTGILDQEMHVIQLPSDEISRATAIYESINKGGVSLNTYDLVVARAARIRSERTLTQKIIDQLKSEISLSEALTSNLKGIINLNWSSIFMGTEKDNKISTIIRDQYLNLLSILSHTNYGEFDKLKIEIIKKEKQLEISPEEINNNTENTVKAIIRACAFLQFRCGKININDLNFKLMLLPIAYVLHSDDIWNSKSSIAKIEYWYWSSLFGGSYRERQVERCINDIKDLYTWIKGGQNPFEERYSRILDNEGYSNKELLLNMINDSTIPSAIQNGILEYVLSNQPRDFYPDKEIFLNPWDIAQQKMTSFGNNINRVLKIEDHHIYPLGAVLNISESSRELRKKGKHILNSPLNRTYITEHANSLISNKSPQEYFRMLPNLTQWGHSISNTNWEKADDETIEEFYERLLTSRYFRLLENIKTELDNLKLVMEHQIS